MPSLKVPLNNFQFGEISGSLTSRTDTQVYNNAGEQVRNFWIRAEGGLKKRAGTRRHYSFGSNSFTKAKMTLRVNNSLNLVGNYVQFQLNDGTTIRLQGETGDAYGNTTAPSSNVGNIYFFRPIISGGTAQQRNETTASRIQAVLNGINGVTATVNSGNAAYVDVERDEAGGQFLDVKTTKVSSGINIDGVINRGFSYTRLQKRLEPFEFSDDEKYIVCFSNERIDVFLQMGLSGQSDSLSTANTMQITGQTWLKATPTAPYIEEMTVAQQGDVMFIAHPTHMIRMLTRTGLYAFSISTFNFDTSFNGERIFQPYFSFQPQGVKLELAGNQAGLNKTLTVKDQDGALFPYFHASYSTSPVLTLNQVEQGKIYYVLHAQTSTAADFQAVGAPTNNSGILFRASVDGDTVTFSGSNSGQVVDQSQFTNSGNAIGTNIEMLGSRLTIQALSVGNTGQNVVGGKTATAFVQLHKDVETKLPVDSIATDEGSNVITITQALHGLSGGNITISNAGAVGGIANSNINGTRAVTVLDDNTYQVTAGASATSSAIGGGTPTIKVTNPSTTNWAEQSYSTKYGYPAAVTFHQNRLWFAGTLGQPDGIWASKSGQYFNFDIGDAEDNDALDITANVGEIQQIRHLVSNRDLQVFTSGAELFVLSPSTKPITPSNAQIKKQTPYGSGFVKPAPFDGATLFVQGSGNALREFLFTDAEDAYTSVAVSALAPHLIRNPTQQAVIKGRLDRSENYSFLLNEDGTIAVFYSIRGEKKAGWALWDTQGAWHSSCSVGSRLYAVCVRDDGSGTPKTFLEEFRSDYPLDFCDRFEAINDINFDTNGGIVTGLTTVPVANLGAGGTHFSTGASVKAINGNDFLGTFTVASANNGSIDVSDSKNDVREIFAGYSFEPKLKTLPIDAKLADGPLTGEPREITKIILDLFETSSVNVKAPSDTSTARDLIIPNVTDDLSLEKLPVTGKEEFRTLGYSRDPRVIVSQSHPLDLQVNGIIVEVAY